MAPRNPRTPAPSEEKKRVLLELLQQHAAAQEEYPLSFAQQRLWFVDQWKPQSALYNIPIVLRLSGTLNIEALISTLNEIVRRHEVLRTYFVTRQDEPVQAIVPQLEIDVPLVDLSELDAATREAEIKRRLQEEARQPFDLTRLPLLRSTLFRMANDEHVLAITAHHIIFDGWSATVMLKEIEQLYEAFATGRPSPLPDLAIQYADFSEWQRDYLQGDVFQEHLDYWKAQFDPPPAVLELPTDHPRPAQQTHNGEHWSHDLPADLMTELEAFCQQEKVSLLMLLLAALSVVLYRYTGQPDIVVGIPIANRNRPEIEALIGFFVNMLPLRVNLDGNPTFRELLRQVRQVALGAYAHQDLPFEKLVESLGVERDPGRSPIFQLMLVLQNVAVQDTNLPDLHIETYPDNSTGTAKYDLSVIVESQASPPCIGFEYNVDLFDAETIARMAQHYQNVLKYAIAHPEQRIAALPLLSTGERRQLLEAWSHSEREYPADKSLYEVFKQQAAKTPDKVAVVHGDVSISYQELADQAEKLAHLIRRVQK